jgi:hypothetical protein
MSGLSIEEFDVVGNDEIAFHTYGISVEDMTPDFELMAAVAENVGLDRRGHTLYQRRPDGEELIGDVEYRERIRVGDRSVLRGLRREVKRPDDGLPPIANAFPAVRAENEEPDA